MQKERQTLGHTKAFAVSLKTHLFLKYTTKIHSHACKSLKMHATFN